MVRFASALLLLAAPAAQAFAPSMMHTRVGLAAARDMDDFDAPIPADPQSGKELDHEILIDDECYLGKYGQYDECVDFGE